MERGVAMKRFPKMQAIAVGTVLAVCGAVAMAGPPTMDPIVFPVDLASIGTAIAAAGVAVLLIIFAYKVAFYFVRKLAKYLMKAV